MTIRPLGATCAAAALFLIAGCEEQTPGTAAPQSSAVPGSSAAPSSSSSEPTPTTSASRPSATSATVATTPAAGGAVAHTPTGAATVMEEFHHALGAKNLETVCRISAPAYNGGIKECRSLTPMLFEMFTPEDLKNLKATRVDPAKVRSKGPDQVTVPPTAIAPKATIMDSEPKTFTMAWRDGTWVIID